jgi:ketosteroid isomerase-like protein
MTAIGIIHRVGIAAALFVFMQSPVFSESNAEVAQLESANAAFDAALSRRDLSALDTLCIQDAAVTALHPPSKAVTVGWPAVRKSWEGAFANFPEMSVQMKNPQVRILGSMAIVTGIEAFRGKRPNGDVVEFLAPTTNVYEKHGEQWLLVHHHAGRAPQ